MNILGFELSIKRKQLSSPWWGGGWGGNWWPIIHEPFGGAWQRNMECAAEDVLAFSTVQSCVSLIAGDISKLGVNLIRQTPDDIWVIDQSNTSFWPVIRKPNHFQTRNQFFETWTLSKLIHGNTYALKARDDRRVVTRLYILDATRVKPLVADDGTVVYELYSDNLAGLTSEQKLFVPSSEIIHDRMNTFYHPLIGVSPLRACAMTAAHGLKNQRMSERLFENHAQPSGILTSAVTLSPEQAKAIQEMWQQGFTGANEGKVAVLGADLKYQQLSFKPSDMELVSQLKLTSEMICSCFHIPPFKVGVGAYPPYGNVQAGNVQYYSDCLQVLIESIEALMDEGLDLPSDLGIEFDVDALLRMDTLTTVDAASKSVGSANMSPNESRKRFYNLPPVAGGDSPYLQQQNFSLEALAKRDAQADPFGSTTPTQQIESTPQPNDERSLSAVVMQKAIAEGLYAAG